jgi:acyl-CoA hydrolase
MEIISKDPMDGSRELCAVAYFTVVALDKDGRTKPCPPETT